VISTMYILLYSVPAVYMSIKSVLRIEKVRLGTNDGD